MQKSIQYILGILTGLATASLAIVLLIVLWHWFNSIQLAPNTPSASPSADVAELANRVQYLENEQKYQLKVIEWKQDQKLLVLGGTALLISFIAAFLGLQTYNDLDKVIREKVNSTLENELYQLDPANLTVRLPKGHPDTPLIRKRLELSGLKNVTEYLELNKACARGLSIVPVNNAEEEQRFRKFLADEKPEPEMAAFVLYTTADPREFRVSVADTLNKYERVATANMPATVITAVLAVARGLHRES